MPLQPDRPIPDSDWVPPARLLAGEYPRNREDATSRPKLRCLLQAGASFFLDLTEEGEGLKPYWPLLQEEAAALGRSVEHRRMAIRDGWTPTPETMAAVLDTLDAALAEGHTVYLHCWGGKGRTGTVLGCYLVRHGMQPEVALREITRLRHGTPDAAHPSPETEEQCQLVRTWQVGG